MHIYFEDLKGYYTNLQMGLPPIYYDGRNDPGLTPWIAYFIDIMEQAFQKVAASAQLRNRLYPRIGGLDPKDKIVLKLLLLKGGEITPKNINNEFRNVNSRTITKWAQGWIEKGLLVPASGEKRIRSYKIGTKYSDIKLSDLGYL